MLAHRPRLILKTNRQSFLAQQTCVFSECCLQPLQTYKMSLCARQWRKSKWAKIWILWLKTSREEFAHPGRMFTRCCWQTFGRMQHTSGTRLGQRRLLSRRRKKRVDATRFVLKCQRVLLDQDRKRKIPVDFTTIFYCCNGSKHCCVLR